MRKVGKTYRNQYLSQQSPKFKRVYHQQILVVEEMLKTGMPVEVKFRDWKALDRFRRKVYELGNATGMRFHTKKLDPYTLLIDLPPEEELFDEITISGRPVEKIQPLPDVELDVEVGPEEQARIDRVLAAVKEEERRETDTESFIEDVFGKGSRDDKEGDKP